MNTTASSNAQSPSFATYLARSYIAKKGFKAATVPEAAGLTAASDIVLTGTSGMNWEVTPGIRVGAQVSETDALSTIDRFEEPVTMFAGHHDYVSFFIESGRIRQIVYDCYVGR